MKITKAELISQDLHLRCECMKEAQGDVVYGCNAKFTPNRAVGEFIALHKANHAASLPVVGQEVPGVVGTDIDA